MLLYVTIIVTVIILHYKITNRMTDEWGSNALHKQPPQVNALVFLSPCRKGCALFMCTHTMTSTQVYVGGILCYVGTQTNLFYIHSKVTRSINGFGLHTY